jgi:hypothetical protein
MKKIILSTSLLVTLTMAEDVASKIVVPKMGAQESVIDSIWKTGGLAQATANVSYYGDWLAGGENNQAYNLLFNLYANWSKNDWLWQNKLELAYGITRQKRGEGNDPWSKNDDKLWLDTKIGYAVISNWYWASLANFKTQFVEAYSDDSKDILVSDFMSPGVLTVSTGVEYKKEDLFSVYLSPATAKGTFVMNDSLAAQFVGGVENGENMKWDGGALLRLGLKFTPVKKVDYEGRVEAFLNYLEASEGLHLETDHMFTAKFNDYLALTAQYSMIMDPTAVRPLEDGVVEKVDFQWRTVYGASVSYSF